MIIIRNGPARALASLIFAVGLMAAAVAQEPSSTDRTTIRSVIAQQIEAFRRDDAAVAYGYAAPEIKSLFPTPERFMDMVRRQYQPVYRPRSVTFGEALQTPSGFLQKVYLTDTDGENWVAAYVLERQADGSWRISGCALVIDEGPNI